EVVAADLDRGGPGDTRVHDVHRVVGVDVRDVAAEPVDGPGDVAVVRHVTRAERTDHRRVGGGSAQVVPQQLLAVGVVANDETVAEQVAPGRQRSALLLGQVVDAGRTVRATGPEHLVGVRLQLGRGAGGSDRDRRGGGAVLRVRRLDRAVAGRPQG